MTDDGWFEHVLDRIERLPPVYFRELVVDVWGLRGFDVAEYEDDGAEFVGFRGPRRDPETEVVVVCETGSQEDTDTVAEAARRFDGARAVAVAKGFDRDEETEETAEDVEFVDAERLARLVDEGGFYWTFYRWVALSEADEPDVVEKTEAPLRYGDDGVVVGRATADRLGASDGDVVRVGGEAAGRAAKDGLLERSRDYVEVGETYSEAVDAASGDEAKVEHVEAEEARRVYVLSVPSMDEELAAELWRDHAPRRGTELSQPYGDGEIRTMALEVLPRDYCYVGDGTDVVVEGYAGARRVFD